MLRWRRCRTNSLAQALKARSSIFLARIVGGDLPQIPVGAALCCEEAIAAEDNLKPYRPLRSTRLLLQGVGQGWGYLRRKDKTPTCMRR